ncbi:MAG TPA: ATP-binding protein [Steroidobacteraceae bacterium]|nr:ATP-binding protein [Steroidobacteraceae bacterium]
MKALEYTTHLRQLTPGQDEKPASSGSTVRPTVGMPASATRAAEREAMAEGESQAQRGEYPQGAASADIRELQRRLEDLEEKLRLRDAALNSTSSHFMIVAADANGPRIRYVNRAICREYGYTSEELIGKPPTVLTPAELNPEAERVIGSLRAQGKGIRVRLRARRKDGSTFVTGVTLTPVRSAGTQLLSVVVGANISAGIAEREAKEHLQNQLVSELRERERMSMELNLARKLESVGRLASGIAHEINTPIHYVGDGVSFLKSAVADLRQLLEIYRDAVSNLAQGADKQAVQLRLQEVETKFDKPFLDEEIPAAFERTHEGIERVAAIVRAMKEFAHPDEHEQSPADINRAIETTLLVTSNEYKYCARVQMELAELPLVMCNIGELNQVFLNIIINAAHAIEAAGRDASTGLINIRTAVADRYVRISIEDNGCGIPKENLDRIFDPFFTTKDVGKGTGQGLAIARSIIVEKHGGRIDVESELGCGSRLILQLPIGGRAAEKIRT